jgi:hypothetical protein
MVSVMFVMSVRMMLMAITVILRARGQPFARSRAISVTVVAVAVGSFGSVPITPFRFVRPRQHRTNQYEIKYSIELH